MSTKNLKNGCQQLVESQQPPLQLLSRVPMKILRMSGIRNSDTSSQQERGVADNEYIYIGDQSISRCGLLREIIYTSREFIIRILDPMTLGNKTKQPFGIQYPTPSCLCDNVDVNEKVE